MKSFIDDDFLLSTPVARELYHDCAATLPVIDYHNHLDAGLLASNHRCDDITELWLDNDPYKHRAMRIRGIPEEYITGKSHSASARFERWMELLPFTIGNPLFHWSCLELKRFFEIDEIPSGWNAREIRERCNAMLAGDGFGMIDILRKCNVEMLCTSDDLLSDITRHKKASALAGDMEIVPSLRGDTILSFSPESSGGFVKRLSEITGVEINSLEDYLQAVDIRIDEFAASGCRYADHSLDTGFRYLEVEAGEASLLFGKVLKGEKLSHEDDVKLRSYVLRSLGERYARRGWVMLLHIGAIRDTNTRLRRLVGPAGGYASIGSACDIRSLVDFLDSLDKIGNLPRTVLFTLNPADNAAFATLTGSYSESGVKGKVQFGPAWWYNDHLEGIESQLQALCSYGLLSGFIGMTTDSRSVLSFSRHEYFRRILCRFLGEKVNDGELPGDMTLLGAVVSDICYNNVKDWSRRIAK